MSPPIGHNEDSSESATGQKMLDMTRTARVLRLIGLLQSRPTWTGPELSRAARRHDPHGAPRHGPAAGARLPVACRPGHRQQLTGWGRGQRCRAAPPQRRGGRGGGDIASAGRQRHGGRARRTGDAEPWASSRTCCPLGCTRTSRRISHATVTLGRSDQRVEGAVALPARGRPAFPRDADRLRRGLRRGEQPTGRARTGYRRHDLALVPAGLGPRPEGTGAGFRLDRMRARMRESTFTLQPREAPNAAEHVREGLTQRATGRRRRARPRHTARRRRRCPAHGIQRAVHPRRPVQTPDLRMRHALGRGPVGLAAVGEFRIVSPDDLRHRG